MNSLNFLEILNPKLNSKYERANLIAFGLFLFIEGIFICHISFKNEKYVKKNDVT